MDVTSFTSHSHYIFGIGNPFASDDKIGLYIIDELLKTNEYSNCYTKKVESDLFEIIDELNKIPDSKTIMLVDAILTDKYSPGSVIVFDFNDKQSPEIKFASVSHSLSIIDIIKMNKAITKRNLSIIVLGVVIKNTDYGEIISKNILTKKGLILNLISKFCNDIEITGIYT